LNAKKAAPPRPPKARPKRGLLGRLLRLALVLLVVFGLIGPILAVAVYRFVPPPITYLMVERTVEGRGFDLAAMEKAMRNNERRPGRIRGGSTISQQTAKNVFLWPDRSYVRKGLEAYFTVLIETMWGKRRIMEVYLNSIEWGPGVYGAEAAAQANFRVGAAALSPAQAARLAAILPSPLKWRAAAPGPYVRKRSGKIGAAVGTVRREGSAACVLS
jgi:monofunctional biosynthetic peptidoglycan transglycosylase